MIQVHLQHIPENESLHLCGETNPSFLDLTEAEVEAIGPLSYDLHVGLSGTGLFATGSLTQSVTMTCVACLEPFEYQIKTTSFAMQRELEGSELVDLTEEVREDIHLLLPMHPRCDMGGNKKCPSQFPNSDLCFRKTSEHCSVEPHSEEKSSIWAILDHLTKN
jgi:uncharacterized metal-binding protein YceD (DUF177 family)